jgi:hypothetical protein
LSGLLLHPWTVNEQCTKPGLQAEQEEWKKKEENLNKTVKDKTRTVSYTSRQGERPTTEKSATTLTIQ